MDNLLNIQIDRIIKELGIKDKLVSLYVKKKKRGTYQALQECSEIEQEMAEKIKEYIKHWLVTELTEGKLKDKVDKQIKDSIYLELARRGYDSILKNK